MMRVRMSTKMKLDIARAAFAPLTLARRAAGFGDVVRVQRGGCAWELDLGEGIEFTVYILGAFERETQRAYRRILRAGDVVLDIGAHIGTHTLPMAHCVGPAGRVIAIEPTDSAFRKLVRNVDLNPSVRARIRTLQVRLVGSGDSGSTATPLFSSWPLRRVDGLHPIHRGRLESTAGAECVTMDALLGRLQLPKVHFVKMDIDGAECDVLAGARILLGQHRPRFVMELMPYGLEEHGASLEELVAIFQSYGYAFSDLRGATLPLDAGALRATIPTGGSRNVIAIPSEI